MLHFLPTQKNNILVIFILFNFLTCNSNIYIYIIINFIVVDLNLSSHRDIQIL